MAERGIQRWREMAATLRPDARGRAAITPALIGRGDRRAFEGDSDLDARLRLARYVTAGAAPDDPSAWTDPVRRMLGLDPELDAGLFHAVRPGSLAEVPRIYVFVHGWVPGSRAFTDELYVEDGQVPMAWDDRIANKVGQTMVAAYEPLLASLAQRDPAAAVLWYSWVDQSGTDVEVFAARRSLNNTGVNGRRLAAALAELIGAGHPQVQLIGHSHGSVVATYAALSMAKPVAQLTLLDCPEDWFSRSGGAAGMLPDILPRLRPGRSPSATFVDSYASMFGRNYHDEPGLAEVVDVRLVPVVKRADEASAASQAHQYPVEWYAATAADADSVGGFAWSPLRGCDTTVLGSAYLATASGRVAEVVRRRPRTRRDPEQATTPLAMEPQELSKRSPDIAYVVTLPEDAVLIEFDIEIVRPAKDTRVDVAVNGQLECSFYAASPVPSAGRFVRVRPGRTTVQFRLIAAGYRTTATVQGLQVLQGPAAIRNLNDAAAMTRVAGLGAGVGAASAFALVALGCAARAAVRRLRCGA